MSLARRALNITRACLLLACCPQLLAQTSLGSITGTITDSTGASIQGASVTATNLQTSLSRTATTGPNGTYVLQQLTVGSYRVSVTYAGFHTVEQSPVVVSTATNTSLDATLSPGVVNETVMVTGAPPPLQTSNAEMSTVVSGRAVQDLPLQLAGSLTGASGRRQIDNFIFLAPGVVGNQWTKYVNGTPSFGTEVVIDGASAQNPIVPGTVGSFGPPFEAVEEFNVQSTAYSAEFSRGFGVMNFTMKSGTNDFHGSAFEFLRNNVFDSRGFFQATRPIVRQNEFGFTFGGPVLLPKIYNGKNRTFFFGSYSGFRLRGGSPTRGTVTLPTVRMKQGDFSQLLANGVQIYDPATTRTDGSGSFVRDPFAGNRIPASQISPVASRLLPFIPNPDIDQTVNNYVSRTTSPTDDSTWSFRLDHAINDAHRLTFSYWWDDRNSPVYTDVAGDLGSAYAQVQKGGGARLNYDAVLRPNLLHHFGFGYNRRQADRAPLATQVGNSILQIPNLPNLQGWPTFSASGYPNLGFLSNYPYREHGHTFELVDNLSWIAGRHQLKFGVDMRWMRYNYFAAANNGGSLSFTNQLTSQPDSPLFGSQGDSFASLMLGYVNSASRLVGVNARGFRFPYYSGFAQDEFRVNSRLTLTYGIRLELPLPLGEAYDRLSALNLTTPNPAAGNIPGALVFAGTGAGRTGHHTFADARMNWAPRLGLAYSLNSKTVVRLGYGLFYAMSNGNLADGVLLDNLLTGYAFPQTVQTTDNGITPAFLLSQGYPAFTGTIPSLNPSLANGNAIDYFNQDGGLAAYTQSWNVSIQRQLPWNLTLDAAYVANKSSHLAARLENLNQVNPKYLALGPTLNANINSAQAQAAGIGLPYAGFNGSVAQALRPFPQYIGVNSFAQPTGNASYQSMQLKVQRRFSSGLTFLGSYTLSKNLGDTNLSGWSGTTPAPLDTYNRGLEKSLTPVDMPHNVVTSFVYELPFGAGKPFASHGALATRVLGGWQISGSTRYSSGMPLGIGGGASLPLFNSGNRPNLVSGAPIRTNISNSDFDPARNLYLNIGAFSQPAQFTFGNVGPRMPNVRGFALLNEDISLNKRTHLTERQTIELRGEFFNIFNRVVFSNPGSSINSPQSFGKVGGQSNVPRVVQLVVKYVF